MGALALLVASIAITDSINPATVGPAIYLATHDRPKLRITEFTGGFLLINAGFGALVVIGPGRLLLNALAHPSATQEHLIELIGGLVMVAIGVGVLIVRDRVNQAMAPTSTAWNRGPLWVGAGLAAAELPTAFLYFGGLAAIIGSREEIPAQLVLVLLYNLIFMAPVLAVIAILMFLGESAERRLLAVGEWLRRRASVVIGALMLVAGAVLTTIGVAGLA